MMATWEVLCWIVIGFIGGLICADPSRYFK